MANTPEGRFIATINRRLPPEIHHESCTSPFRGGTPDQYYEGDEGTCRIEYKFIKAQKLPTNIELGNEKKKYGLSSKQNEWLIRAFYNGVTVAVVLASQHEVILFSKPSFWNSTWKRQPTGTYYSETDDLVAKIFTVDRDFIAKWIIENVT